MNAQEKTTTTPPKSPRQPLKIELALELVIEADRAGKYVFAGDARNAFGDYAWHSTVDNLRGKGLEFLQRPVAHPNRNGGRTRFQEYRLTPGSREKAERLLAEYQARP